MGTTRTPRRAAAETWLVAKKIDAFTDAPMTGNPAGLVVCDADLSEGQMQRMAREMNVSETVFVGPDTVGEADRRLRYFTPTTEVPICGHATIAALHHLANVADAEGSPAPRAWTFSTRVGVLRGWVADGVNWMTLDRTVVKGGWPDDTSAFVDALGGDPSVLAGDGRAYLFHDGIVAIEVKDVAALDTLAYDPMPLKALGAEACDSLVAFATHGCLAGRTWHQRMFAPAVGIDEDPVTGVATARVANLLAHLGRLPAASADGVVRMQQRQGDAMGRAGDALCELLLDARGRVSETRVGGRAVTVLEGRMRVPSG